MADNFKLPGSSYEELVKIIKAYSTGKIGMPMALDVIAQTAGMDKTIVSRNNGFLVQLGFISEGNKKAPTQEGIDLGRAYNLKMDDQIIRIWTIKIENDEFLSRMLAAIKIRNGMEKTSLINHILYSSGSSNNTNTRAGANTIIEIFKCANLVGEADGNIVANEESTKKAEDISVSRSKEINSYNSVEKTIMVNDEKNIVTINLNVNLNISIDQIDEATEKIRRFIEKVKE